MIYLCRRLQIQLSSKTLDTIMTKIYSSLIIALLCSVYSATAQERLHEAQWISAPHTKTESMPMFRKSISIQKEVKDVTIYASALGVYQIYANGKNLTDDVLMPGWTDYRKSIQYQRFHIQQKLHAGDKLSIASVVSKGWWAGGISRGIYGNDTNMGFICDVHIVYMDGTTQDYLSDTTWKCYTSGALVMGDIYNGETYDARKDKLADVSTPSYNDNTWQSAIINTNSKGELCNMIGPQIKIRDKSLWRKPQNITIYKGADSTNTTFGKIHIINNQNNLKNPIHLKKGQTLLVDFGQNIVGWIDMNVKGIRGTTLTWKHGEMLNFNGDESRLDKGSGGSLWTWNLREAKATNIYVMSGNETGEEYHPNHTYFGFRYAELTATSDVTINKIEAQVVGTDLREWGTFECSDPNINRLYSNVWWGQRGNFMSIPTDCPQRDERLGWTGDTQIFSRTALYNSDAAEFYRKWMRDMRDSQREDGAYPETAPFCNMWGYGTAGWGDAGIIVPWNTYVMTGDKDIIKENWQSMQKWMEFCSSQHDGQWTHIGAEPKCGDWLAYKEVDARYVSYAYFAYSAELMQKMAEVIGKSEEASKYGKLWNDIRDEFQKRYITDGEINTGKDTQTAYLLALHFNLILDNQRQQAMDALRKNIIANDYKLSTGFIGTGILMETLTECGMTDLAYRLLFQHQNPSWLYSIDQGATTIWERWDSYTRESGFNKHPWNMNSFNHYSYGAVVEWFYSSILGIRPDEQQPGFHHIILEPHPGTKLQWAKGSTMTKYGKVSVEWKKATQGRIHYMVTIPQGTSATLITNNERKEVNAGKHTYCLTINE